MQHTPCHEALASLSTTRVVRRSDVATPMPNQLDIRAVRRSTDVTASKSCLSRDRSTAAPNSGSVLSRNEAERLAMPDEPSPSMLMTTELAALEREMLSD